MQGDWLERQLERKRVNPLFLIAFFAVTIAALLWAAMVGAEE